MSKYTVRTEQVDGGWVAHIDQDGLICIMQPNFPGLEGNFASQIDAKTWADTHAAELEAGYEAGIAAAALKEEREAAQHAANLALVALLERLTNPSA
jgi:cation transporter-like permease